MDKSETVTMSSVVRVPVLSKNKLNDVGKLSCRAVLMPSRPPVNCNVLDLGKPTRNTPNILALEAVFLIPWDNHLVRSGSSYGDWAGLS
ncbi:hypothetical protein RRG08_039604 [Elysia crispata]|uniref:Uncharacterized protein n=1 Tax=Elysia crispata TaxID=231223 RepID=A0AAE1AKW7_9GAST|nr:hypothetical protein RRG08_039604 [Elysia crispata]